MILGDSEIKRMMAEGYFPAYPKLLINPASMNVRIGASFLVPRRKWFGSVALGDEVKYKKQEAECTLIKFLAESLVIRRTVLRRVFYPRE